MSYEYLKKDALVSDDSLYRYWLTREWQLGEPDSAIVCWIMLNPSTADASEDDPTIRKCAINFTNAWGFRRLAVVNLFAFRATLPEELNRARDPIGPDNDVHILFAAKQAKIVVAGWGVNIPKAYPSRPKKVLEMLEKNGVAVKCLGRNNDGSPKHPLYLKNTTELIDL